MGSSRWCSADQPDPQRVLQLHRALQTVGQREAGGDQFGSQGGAVGRRWLHAGSIGVGCCVAIVQDWRDASLATDSGSQTLDSAVASASVSPRYFSATEDAMGSPPLMQPWARLALAAALRARATKPRATRAVRDASPRKGASAKAPA